MMEVLLNAIWLLVATGAFLFWLPERYRGKPSDRRRGRPVGILALVCALVLLFPVISLTDDLHAEQAPMEDSSRAVMKARSLVQGCLRASSSQIPAAVIPGSYSGAALYFYLGTCVPLETLPHCPTPISAHDGRSPPYKG